MIHSYQNKSPKLNSPAFIAQSAEIIGDVIIEKDASVWYNTTLRGDINQIYIGRTTNIQDNAVVHVTEQNPTIIDEGVTVGHSAIVHACKVGKYSLIGMGACILDGSVIGEYVLIAAGSVVLPNSNIPDGVLVAGIPGKIIRQLKDEEKLMLEKSASDYLVYAKSHFKK